MKQHHIGWAVIVAAILAALWLIFSRQGKTITQASTVALGGTDPITGCPIINSVPTGSVAPISGNTANPIDNYPPNPALATCPEGYQLVKDATTSAYWCVQVA